MPKPALEDNSLDVGTARDGTFRDEVLTELGRILRSPFFRKSPRGSQFLSYIVEHKLDGLDECLKERTIGVEVFRRPPGYATGDDPVVRVQASDVRRRLEQYYQAQAASGSTTVRIELPVGSYAPTFQWPLLELSPPAPIADPPPPERNLPRRHIPIQFWAVAALCCAIAFAAGVATVNFHRVTRPKSNLEQFWAPVFATQQPVLICLAKPAFYRPTLELYQRYAATHPDTFRTELERWNEPLPLAGDEKLSWKDMTLYTDYGVATGDVYAAVKFSALLGQLGKAGQVRIGSNYSFEDLRNSPAVAIGAFNNRYTMRLTSNLHFTFVEENGGFLIREQIPGGRVWSSDMAQGLQSGTDYAIVGRLLDSKTGQFAIVAGGITASGTQAAGEFASSPESLNQALRNAPPDWPAKNSLFVIETTVTDSVAGPPQVVASYFW